MSRAYLSAIGIAGASLMVLSCSGGGGKASAPPLTAPVITYGSGSGSGNVWNLYWTLSGGTPASSVVWLDDYSTGSRVTTMVPLGITASSYIWTMPNQGDAQVVISNQAGSTDYTWMTNYPPSGNAWPGINLWSTNGTPTPLGTPVTLTAMFSDGRDLDFVDFLERDASTGNVTVLGTAQMAMGSSRYTAISTVTIKAPVSIVAYYRCGQRYLPIISDPITVKP